MIRLTCDNCEKLFETEDDAAGGKVACPYCGDINRIPAPPVAPVPVAHVASMRPKAEVAAPRSPQPVGRPMESEPEQRLAVIRQAMFRAHPFWYLLMVAVFVVGIVLLVFSQPSQPLGNAPWLRWVGVVLAAIAVLWWICWWAAPHRWIKLTITNKRVIRQEGIIQRTTNELLYRHINDIIVKQRLLQRLLNVGYIGIDSAGQGGNMEDKPGQPERRSEIEIEVENIPKPYQVKEMINKYRM